MIFNCLVENHHNEPPTKPFKTQDFPITKLMLIVGPTTYGPSFLLDSQIQRLRTASRPRDWRIELFPESGVHPSCFEDVVADKLAQLRNRKLTWMAVRTHSLELLDAFLDHPELPTDTTVVWVSDDPTHKDTAVCHIITLTEARYKRHEYHEDLR